MSKISVLKKIAHLLNSNNITWSLGGSCMLYLRGITDTFEDIDIRIKESDISKTFKLLSEYEYYVRYPNESYRTINFIELAIEGIEIDIMSGFTIVNQGLDHYFPLDNSSLNDQHLIDDEIIILDSVKEWVLYYTLMKREDKIELLKLHV